MDPDALAQALKNVSTYDVARSGGPGGQNVNKLNTKVVLRVPVGQLPLSEAEAARIRRVLENRINREDELVIHSSETRSQTENRTRAEERALGLLLEAATPPKRRKRTRPSKAAGNGASSPRNNEAKQSDSGGIRRGRRSGWIDGVSL